MPGPGSVSLWIGDAPANGYRYVPGQTVELITRVAEQGTLFWGFQVTARQEDLCSAAGTMAVSATEPDVQVVRIEGGTDPATGRPMPDDVCSGTTIEYATHTKVHMGTNTIDFVVDYTFPTDGPVQFAAAGNAVNGDRYNWEDTVYSTESVAFPRDVATPQPTISEGGVILATGVPVKNRLAPGALASVFGTGFTDEAVLAPSVGPDGRLGTSLAGVCVEVGGTPGAMLAVTPIQANFQVPAEAGLGPQDVVVIRDCAGPNPLASVPAATGVDAYAPALFVFAQKDGGSGPVAALFGGGPDPAGNPEELGSAFRRAAPGDAISLFATGLGPTERPLATGEVPGDANPLTAEVGVRLGEMSLAAENILYAGSAPCCAGLYQIVIRIPDAAPSGDLAVILEAGGVASPAGPYLSVG